MPIIRMLVATAGVDFDWPHGHHAVVSEDIAEAYCASGQAERVEVSPPAPRGRKPKAETRLARAEETR